MNKLYEENDIQAIADSVRNKQGYVGKNNFDDSKDWSVTRVNATFTKKDGELVITAVGGGEHTINLVDGSINGNYASSIRITENNAFFLKKGTYYFSAESSALNEYFLALGNIGDTYSSSTGKTFVYNQAFTINEDCYATLGIYVSTSAGYYRTISNIQIEEGTEQTPYEPFCRYKVSQMPKAIDVITEPIIEALNNKNIYGKNLLELKDFTSNIGGRTYRMENNKLTITGNSWMENTINLITGVKNGNYSDSIRIEENNATYLEAGTYTISYVGNSDDLFIAVGNIGDNYDANTGVNVKNNKTFTITEGKFITLGMYDYKANGEEVVIDKLMIEKGEIATKYEPFNTFNIPEMAEAIGNISGDAVLDITNDDKMKLEGNTLIINNTEIHLVEIFNDGTIAEGYSVKQTSSAGVAPSVNIGSRIAVSGTSNSGSGSEGQLYIDKVIDFSKVEKIEIYGSGSTSASNKGNNGGIFRIVTDYSKVTNLSDSYAVQLGCTSNMFTNGEVTFTKSVWEGVKNAYIVIRSRVDYGGYNYNYNISKIVIYIRENI